MSQKIAIAVIHGMGSQGAVEPPSHVYKFSHDLYHGLRQIMGDAFFENVIWREVFWSHILQERQEKVVQALDAEGARWMGARRFAMQRLADAAAYHREASGPGSATYQGVHGQVAKTLAELERLGGGDTPLLVFAHSLGGHIMSNFMYDLASDNAVVDPESSFQRLETLTHFVTFGSNIPLFTFNEPADKIRPNSYPGTRVEMRGASRPWWYNYNDRDDALGMPLAASSPNYQAMIDEGALHEQWINTSPWFKGMTPLSHNAFWKDRNFHQMLVPLIKAAQGAEIAPVQTDTGSGDALLVA